MGLFCCQRCHRYSNCGTKWIRGEKHEAQLCCPECLFYLLCKDGVKKGKGIDIGTVFIKCAQKLENDIVFKRQRNAFFEMKNNNFTRYILDKAGTAYLVKEDKLYVIGNESLEFAYMFAKEVRRPLRQGVISSKEKEAGTMLELLIKSTVGEASYPGEIAYYSIPGEPVDSELDIFYHETLLAGFLRSLGYNPKTINEGQAVILSELANEKFTGMGLSFGGGMVNVCFSYMSVPIFKFSVTKAGDWIDQQVAMATDETAVSICAIKESSLDLSKGGNTGKVEKVLSIYYDHLIEYVIENIRLQFSQNNKIPMVQNPISIVLAGGTSLPRGFVERFKQILGKLKLPIPVGEVRLAQQPLISVVTGALIAVSAEGKQNE